MEERASQAANVELGLEDQEVCSSVDPFELESPRTIEAHQSLALLKREGEPAPTCLLAYL